MKVAAYRNAAGDVAIGVEEDGHFIPFSSLSAGKYAQLVQRAETLKERAAKGDERAKDVLGDAYKEPSSASKAKTETGKES